MTIPATSPLRASFYIDGFNLYHGLKDHSKARECRWLNLWSLADSLALSGHKVEKVFYFTSIPPWSSAKTRRHETYIAALESVGVEVVRGRFQKDYKECLATCRLPFEVYVEKLTDVHIATSILRDGSKDRFDWAYLVSGDADQAPTVTTLREMAPTKGVHVILPPRRDSVELKQVADSHIGPLTYKQVKRHLLPDTITVGTRIIQKPATW